MTIPARFLTAALALLLATAPGALGAVTAPPQFSTSTFTRAQTGNGNAVTLTLTWLPATFTNPSADDHQEVSYTDLAGGSPQTFTVGAVTKSVPLLLTNGHQYAISIAACQVQFCPFGSPGTTQATLVDATPPAGTVQINGGALATNNRTVALTLAATDPLIDGLPGTSSGVTQVAADVDGDGTFPCNFFVGPGATPDSSGCAVAFAPSVPATLPAGDGSKTLGVKFGDGARANTSPCPSFIFCAILLGSFIEGNVSPVATDTILLDTVKPKAVAILDRTSVERGGAVVFNSSTSLDTSPTATPSGVDPASATWDFKDGTPPVTGAKVTHVFTSTGTFVGQLRVTDRAGNVSDAGAFTVIVAPTPGEAAAGGGSIAGVSGTAAFSVTRLRVRARYVKSRLKGSVAVDGTSTLAGGLRVELRKRAGTRSLRTRSTTLAVAPFTTSLSLPATLLPGRYRLALTGPGGTLSTTLTLTAPREGVISAGRVRRSSGSATARFTFAARPLLSLRKHLSVKWTQGGRSLGTVAVGSGRVVTGTLPAGAGLGTGLLRAELRAGSIVVGSAAVRVR